MSGAVVSVITIFLDEIEFLGEAIDSVREQDFTSWELLLCDDGSTDGSHELALRHAAEDDRIRVLTHPDRENRGMSAARNLGLCHARGRYVAFLDGDDRWPTDKLRTQVAALDTRPAVALVAGASTYWRSWSTGDPSDDVVVPVGAPAGAVVEPPDLTTMLYPLGTGAAPCLCDLMVRRDVVEAVGGFEEQFRGLYEDQAFLLKVYLRHSVYIAEGSPSWYRQHPDSCVATATADGRYHALRRSFLDWLGEHLDQHDVHDPAVRLALGAVRRDEPVTGAASAKNRLARLRGRFLTILGRHRHGGRRRRR